MNSRSVWPLAAAVMLALQAAWCVPAAATEETITFGSMGTVSLYHQSAHPSRVVLFVSGDGGWNQGVVDMARILASMDALVAGIDIRHYLKALDAGGESCSYPASDFELLSKYIQKKLDFPRYITPTLVGYSSGATLVYAILVQAPPTTFTGAISMGFCPDLPLVKPLCKGSGLEWGPGPHGKGVSFLPSRTLEVPWVAFQGTIDQVCEPKAVQDYVGQVPKGRLVMLPKVGHGFSVPRNWEPQFREAFTGLAPAPESPPPGAQGSADVEGLPLIEVPAEGTQSDLMAVIITGDGGWGVTDKGVGRTLASHGIPVVALNSLHYFWNQKTPDECGADLTRLLRHYLTTWSKSRVLLVGYSLGADVLPFMISRLPADVRSSVGSIALLGPSRGVDFKFHLGDWLGSGGHENDQPVLPELEKLKGMKILAFYGDREEDSLGPQIPPGLARVVRLRGGHRIGGGYEAVADSILSEAR